MKTLIIALLISSVVSGQQSWKANKVTITELPIDWLCNCHPSPVGQWSDFLGGPAKYSIPVKDTIPCLFLVTDTSRNTTRINSLSAGSCAFPVKGFRVLENGYGYNADMTTSPMKYLISYLDSNKKPLPKTWVVWQTSIY